LDCRLWTETDRRLGHGPLERSGLHSDVERRNEQDEQKAAARSKYRRLVADRLARRHGALVLLQHGGPVRAVELHLVVPFLVVVRGG
jgi:hypothetical protein